MALPQPPMPQTATCYRHPGREAGRRCTRCGRPACTECLVQASVGSHCVECAKAGPARRGDQGPLLERPPADARHVRDHRPQRRRVRLAGHPGHARRSLSSTHDAGPSSTSAWPSRSSPTTASGTGWSRPGFLHFGIIHIAFNMLLLFQLGHLLEPAIGRVRFGLLYFAALLAGSAGALLVSPNALSRRGLRRRVRADGGGVRRPAQPRRQPVLDRHRHGAGDQPAAHVHASPASRSAATSAASSAACSPAG